MEIIKRGVIPQIKDDIVVSNSDTKYYYGTCHYCKTIIKVADSEIFKSNLFTQKLCPFCNKKHISVR